MPIAGSAPTVTLAAELRGKDALEVLKAMFTVAGIDPTVAHDASTQLRITKCPLGQTSELVAMPPAPVAGLDANTVFTLEMSRDPDPSIRCTFSDNLPADTANSIPASRTSSFLEYLVTYVPGPQLKNYLSLLDHEGFERLPGTTVGGVVYNHCTDPDASVKSAKNYRNCAAIWLNGVVVVGLRFAGPDGSSVDVTSWLARMIEPVISSLANTDASAAGVPVPSSTP